MSLKLNMIIQGIAILVQVANLAAPFLPNDAKIVTGAAVGGIQAFIAGLAHLQNPDGTAAVEPWKTGSAGKVKQ